ncbi:hypothetical protein K439DRAFT_1635675 [Ramaria rubella]|nr:hypothetical protein K439DRAFT_1635675 [Ramaria rubella]
MSRSYKNYTVTSNRLSRRNAHLIADPNEGEDAAEEYAQDEDEVPVYGMNPTSTGCYDNTLPQASSPIPIQAQYQQPQYGGYPGGALYPPFPMALYPGQPSRGPYPPAEASNPSPSPPRDRSGGSNDSRSYKGRHPHPHGHWNPVDDPNYSGATFTLSDLSGSSKGISEDSSIWAHDKSQHPAVISGQGYICDLDNCREVVYNTNKSQHNKKYHDIYDDEQNDDTRKKKKKQTRKGKELRVYRDFGGNDGDFGAGPSNWAHQGFR